MTEFVKTSMRRINIDDISWYLPSNSSIEFQLAVKMKCGDQFVFSGEEAKWLLVILDHKANYYYDE